MNWRGLKDKAERQERIFSIFSCGCKQYKSVHYNSAAKITIHCE